MGSRYLARRIFFFVLLVSGISSLVTGPAASQTVDENRYKTYLVVGAFQMQRNAQTLAQLVTKYDFNATIMNNEFRGLYYVYVYESMDRDEVKKRVLDLRTRYDQFYDAWAYTGDFKDQPVYTEAPLERETQIEEQAYPEVSEHVGGAALQPQEEESKAESLVAEEETEQPVFEKKEGYYYFYFNTINSKNLKEVKGKIKIIDPERAKQLKEAKSHELVELADPDNGTRKIIVATDIFGFKEVQHTLDLDDPQSLKENPAVEVRGDSIIVDFDLQRFKKGDVLVMYNVYFFKDAAIMKPESVYELNSLLDMVNENKNLAIMIHGHTNGNSHGKIIHLDLEDKNFFGINGEHKESVGSAKKLSLYRAYTIQHWLMEQGIEEARMDIRGWGGKRMVFDKFDTQAEKNVRVEIEILRE